MHRLLYQSFMARLGREVAPGPWNIRTRAARFVVSTPSDWERVGVGHREGSMALYVVGAVLGLYLMC